MLPEEEAPPGATDCGCQLLRNGLKPAELGDNKRRMHDVVVIGAGPGGSCAAHFLARGGLDVLLLDKREFPREKTCGDGLTPRALRLLDELGVLEEAARKGRRLERVTVFACNGTPVNVDVPEREGYPAFLLTVRRVLLDELLRDRALASGARFRGKFVVEDIEVLPDHLVVKGRHSGRPTSVRGRLAVVATGANLGLLKRLGILAQSPPMILAAQAYYENVEQLPDTLEFHFDGVPLPGYGWVFPLSATTANIGAGLLQSSRRNGQKTARTVMDEFLATPRLEQLLANARRVSPIKGYPLRTDFATAPTYGPRTVLVGEAAGLVNPLTGEGVDFALESGKIAAEQLLAMFADGDFSDERLAEHDRRLRAHFQRTFAYMSRMRRWYLRPWLINLLARTVNRRAGVRRVFTDVLLGYTDAAEATSLKTIMQILLP